MKLKPSLGQLLMILLLFIISSIPIGIVVSFFIPTGKELVYPMFSVVLRSDIDDFFVGGKEYRGEGIYIKAGDLVKPLLELTPADVEVLGFENAGPDVLYRKWPGNYCEFNSELKLTHLQITGTSGICVGKSRTGPFICFPTSRKEFESVFGKAEKTVNLYDVVTWR